jgi:hypothetical protein
VGRAANEIIYTVEIIFFTLINLAMAIVCVASLISLCKFKERKRSIILTERVTFAYILITNIRKYFYIFIFAQVLVFVFRWAVDPASAYGIIPPIVSALIQGLNTPLYFISSVIILYYW